jgi:hypothetical protein
VPLAHKKAIGFAAAGTRIAVAERQRSLMMVRVMIPSLPLATDISSTSPGPFLTFVGVVPRSVEGRGRRSAAACAVPSLRDPRDGRNCKGCAEPYHTDDLQHFFSPIGAWQEER